IAALSSAVWAHHMFVTGAVLLPFFSFMTFLIAGPPGRRHPAGRADPAEPGDDGRGREGRGRGTEEAAS
ncbi:hypothetical protein, partial [Corynebacterium bovis]|uniref:hypothetical protein n=1 Tax=Corynebacterium bovis TaxID=36808 RepID=UPI001639950B